MHVYMCTIYGFLRCPAFGVNSNIVDIGLNVSTWSCIATGAAVSTYMHIVSSSGGGKLIVSSLLYSR